MSTNRHLLRRFVHSHNIRSLWKYARYFARRHPKVVEDEKVLEVVVLRLEEDSASKQGSTGRRMTVRTFASPPQADAEDIDAISPMQNVYRIVEEPEPQPAHTRGNAQALANDGIEVTDYFFGQQSMVKREKIQGEARKEMRRKTSFGAWCRGYDSIEV